MSKKRNVCVSVIIPYYNEDPQLLERAVESVVQQPFRETEILIINDGSNKSLDEALDKICKKDKRIRLINQENMGVSSARNHGIREASGEYLFFLDADDELTTRSIPEAYRIAKRYDADMLIGGTQIIDADIKRAALRDKITVVRINEKNKSKYKCALTGKMMYFYDDVYMNRGIASRFIKRQIAAATLFDEDVRIAEDLLFTLDVFMKSKKVMIVKDLWYLYHHVEGSATHKYSKTLDEDTAIHLKKIKKYFDLDKKDECAAFSARILYCLNFIGRYKYFHKDNKEGFIRSCREMLRLYDSYPWNLLNDTRFLKAASGVDKALLGAYRLKLYYLIYMMKLKLKG